MSDRRKISPVEGHLVPDHQKGGRLPKEGREVIWDMEWAGQLHRGSIQVHSDPAPMPARQNRPARVPVEGDEQ